MQVLKEKKMWVPAGPNNKDEYKVPLIKKNHPKEHLAHSIALARSNNMAAGVCIQQNDPYVILDVDCDPDKPEEYDKIPTSVYNWIDEHPTYVEYSMSKKGLHIVYKLDERSHELLLAKAPDFSLKTEKLCEETPHPPFTGQFMFAKCFVVITGEQLTGRSQDEIATINLETLLSFAPLTKQEVENYHLLTQSNQVASTSSIDLRPLTEALPDLTQALMAVPTTVDYYTTAAYDKLKYDKSPDVRKHWLNIGMALAHFATQYPGSEQQVFNLYDEWSSRDPEKYKGPQDVLKTWSSFKNKSSNITKSLIFKLRNNLTPLWPVLAPDTNGKMRPVYENTQCLQAVLNYHQLTLVGDVFNFDTIFARCREVTANHLFGKDEAQFPRFAAEESGWVYVDLKTTSKDAVVNAMQKILEGSRVPPKAYTKTRTCNALYALGTSGIDFISRTQVCDRFKSWVETKEYDESVDAVEAVQQTLHYDPNTDPRITKYYRSIIYKVSLWGLAVHYMDKPQDAPTVPILVGKEKIGKTSWPKDLLYSAPFYLPLTSVITDVEDKKEFIRSIVSCKVGVLDEYENVVKNSRDSKNIVVSATPTVRPHYKNATIKIRRYSMAFGTTNSAMAPDSGGEGDRRQARIVVQNCDLDALWEIDHQQFWAQLKRDYFKSLAEGNTQPWMLTDEEDAITNELMEKAAAKSSVRRALEGIFNTSVPFDSSTLLGPRGGLKQRKELEANNLAVPITYIVDVLNTMTEGRAYSGAEVTRAAINMCSTWTDSKLKLVKIPGCKRQVLIENGQIDVGDRILFILPPRKD